MRNNCKQALRTVATPLRAQAVEVMGGPLFLLRSEHMALLQGAHLCFINARQEKLKKENHESRTEWIRATI